MCINYTGKVECSLKGKCSGFIEYIHTDTYMGFRVQYYGRKL